jgi:predicted MPP superfamily phosphohydrolase
MQVTRRQLLGTVAAGGAAAIGAGLYGVVVEPRRLGVTRATLLVAGLPPALAGMRIGLATDIHHGESAAAGMVSAVTAALQSEAPDLVVLAGDYVTWSDRQAVVPCAAALEPLRAPLGTFAALGNHDPESTVKAEFEARGIRVLRDEHEDLDVRGEPVSLAGLKYWSRKPEDLQRAFRGARGFPILIAHDPRRLNQAAEAGVALVLSGHTHGGQVVLPGIGAPAAARFPVVHGAARRRHTTIFVSRGVGMVVLPVRINCPPEVAILTLARA